MNQFVNNKWGIFKISLLVLLSLLMFQNCTEKTDNLNEFNTHAASNDNPVIGKLLKMGYQLDEIEELDEFFLVQGELKYSKNIDDYREDSNIHTRSATISGPDALCVNESGVYCVSAPAGSVTWSGHPSINGSTAQCVTLSSSSQGTGFIYANISTGGNSTFISKKVHIGVPDIVNNLTVNFDPCLSMIYIEVDNPNASANFTWSSFTGLNNAPLVAYTTKKRNRVTLRSLYGPGEELCFSVSATNNCGTYSTPCDLCFTTPDCTSGGGTTLGQLSNSCPCPSGFNCIDGVCCPTTPPANSCTSNFDCGLGYQCINGICVSTQGDQCINNSHCPPGMKCKKGFCI